ncbi:N-acetylglucosamine kinase [Thalassotalea sp. PS06]|uniref:N-acetylglucosamine kinase n=1 Tax=Thalassotalea sp. PS06 TaxID=2594005 RepID=UPI00116540DA|nr:BadF/BadG/BcrA/BcrD ATPase family protein [Thalassotalea sp. PS06]QDP01882.1 ATPase [Thalassotalea sp. PS06]
MHIGHQQLYLGIDGGGSKCKAVIVDAEMQCLGEGIAGAANPFHSVDNAQQSIVDAALLALADAGLEQSQINQLIAGVGLAGVNIPKYFDLMNAWQHPFKEMHLATDLHIACLGAHNGDNGAIMICGTGSVGYVSCNGDSLIVGGHGFPQGDTCSGAWLGLQAVQKVLLAADDLGAQTTLTKRIYRALGCLDSNDLVSCLSGQGATYYARLAIHVFDAADEGDLVAQQILAQASNYFTAVFNKLMAKEPARISLIGGLQVRLKDWLATDIFSQFSEPMQAPEIGAVLFARQQSK